MKDADRNSEPLDAVLRRAMREPPAATTPECADAESIAAYFDGSIAAAERERLEAHFADCARCQAQLAAIARADESARAASAASKAPWYRRWQFAIPALAAAAAVAVLVAIRRAPVEQSKNAEVVAMAKREAPVASAPVPEQAPAGAPAAAPPALLPSAPKQLAMNEPGTNPASRAEAKSATRMQRMATGAEGPDARASAPAPVEAPAGSGRVVAIAPAAPFAAPRPAAPAMESWVAGKAAPATAPAAVGGAVASFNAQTISRAETEIVKITTPDGTLKWVAGKDGMVRRHDPDTGFHPQHSGVTTDLTAGAAPSASVCWIVGRSGTIIRTTDGGEHWELIKPPASENFATVSASSASDATITTAGGHKFATSDGGESWRAL